MNKEEALCELCESMIADFRKLGQFIGDAAAKAVADMYQEDLDKILENESHE